MLSKFVSWLIAFILLVYGSTWLSACQSVKETPMVPSTPTAIHAESPSEAKVQVFIYGNPNEFQTGVITCEEIASLEWSFSETESGLYLAESPELGLIGLQTADIYTMCPNLPYPFFGQ